jgi:hypothetical protein
MQLMAKEDRSNLLRGEIEDLKEEAVALADRAKRTARQAQILAERIKHLESQLSKTS